MMALIEFAPMIGTTAFNSRLTRLAILAGSFAIICVASSRGCLAQTMETATGAPGTRDEARQLKDRASAMKADAEQQYDRDTAECYSKVLVAHCIEDAKERRRKSLAAAQEVERQGRETERAINNREREAKAAQRAGDASRKEAEEQARTEKMHQDQAKKEAKREAKRTEEARQNAEAEKLRPERMRKQQEHEKKMTEEIRKSEERKRKKAEDEKRRDDQAAAKLAAEEEARRKAGRKEGFMCKLSFGYFCSEENPGK